MRVIKKIGILLAIAGCLGQTVAADCGDVSRKDHQATDREAQRSRDTDPRRIVSLELEVERSRVIGNAKVLSGPAELVPYAVRAVTQKKYEFKQGSANLHKISVDVMFAPDSNTVTELIQMFYVIGGDPYDEVVGMKQGVFAGSSSCVSGGRLRVSQESMKTHLLSQVKALYPEEARVRGIEGTVVLHVVIDTSGNVSSANKYLGPDVLAPAAIDAVKLWKYQPYVLNGTPVKVDTMINIYVGS